MVFTPLIGGTARLRYAELCTQTRSTSKERVLGILRGLVARPTNLGSALLIRETSQHRFERDITNTSYCLSAVRTMAVKSRHVLIWERNSLGMDESS